MGSSVSVREPYDYSLSFDTTEEGTHQRGLIPAFSSSSWRIRRRSSSLSSEGRPSFTLCQLVNIHLLDVPYVDRHPFSDYRFGKKLGE
jgi:hypothetical protein